MSLPAELNDTTQHLRGLSAELKGHLQALRVLVAGQIEAEWELCGALTALCSISAEVSRWEALLGAARMTGELPQPGRGAEDARQLELHPAAEVRSQSRRNQRSESHAGGTPVPLPAAKKRVASREHPAHQARDHKSAAAGDFDELAGAATEGGS